MIDRWLWLLLTIAMMPGCVPTDCQALRLICAHRCSDPYTKRACLELAYDDNKEACEASYRRYARACPDVESIFDEIDDDIDDDFWDSLPRPEAKRGFKEPEFW